MELHELLRKVVETFENLQIPYLITGSVASMAYGEPRLTNDIDLVAQIAKDNVGGLMKAFPSTEFYISEEMIREAIDRCGQFNIIHPVSGLKVDVMIKQSTPFDESRFRRVRQISPAESYQANFASPEDVIIKKMEYYRDGGSEKHLRDITGILIISENEVDRGYISEWTRRLNLDEIWEAVQKRLGDKS
ncbi:MAG: hypothetical protein QME66_12755 [Candidatus Eisenbacteria bacterium]|nr:hypothetical protein [Candidatus Eisenbacteria bacterium]